MKQLFNKIVLLRVVMAILVVTMLSTLSSCKKEELEIQNNFPFEVEVMPVPGEIVYAARVEIRIQIKRSGNFKGTRFYIRYFQYEGAGTLRYFDQVPYRPNDRYLLAAESFRLYYTSGSKTSHSFDVWISDNFGNERKLSFEFRGRD